MGKTLKKDFLEKPLLKKLANIWQKNQLIKLECILGNKMFPGMNPKKMQAVMKQMGISQDEISASRVVIEKIDDSKIIIENPSVTKIKMQGQETFQIAGEIREETSAPEISEEDVKTVVEKTGKSEEEVKEVLERTGDLAEAILKLS
jgi:nascent polypeptide-associated complex subunit alpha